MAAAVGVERGGQARELRVEVGRAKKGAQLGRKELEFGQERNRRRRVARAQPGKHGVRGDEVFGARVAVQLVLQRVLDLGF